MFSDETDADFLIGKPTWAVQCEGLLASDDVGQHFAVDGDISEDMCMLTNPCVNPWWAVDLGHDHEITDIKLWGRLDEFGLCKSPKGGHVCGMGVSMKPSLVTVANQLM